MNAELFNGWAGWLTQHARPWLPLIGTVAALLALMLLWALVRRSWRRGRAGRGYDSSADRFGQTAPINERQVELLRYLQQAFADGVVLFRPRLTSFLAVRRTRDRLGAQQRLAEQQVDFLVCADDGKPLFAFEVDAFKDGGQSLRDQEAAEKNRMLKSAGIRLIRLRGTLDNYPPPEILRMRLQAAQRTPVPAAAEPGASDFKASGFSASGFASSGFSHSRGADSGVMSLTGLMALPDDEDPWSAVRKR